MGKIVVAMLLILAASLVNAQPVELNKYGEPIPVHFDQLPHTDKNTSVLLIDVPTNCEFGIITASGLCVGATSSVDQTKVGIAVWGDSPKTTEIDGAIEGERFNVFYADKNGRRYDIDYEIIEGTDIYKPDELLVIQWRDSKFADPKYGIMPNVGSTPGVTINLKEAAQINLVLCDLKGKKIADVTSGQQTAGAHTFKLDASAAPKGDHLQILRTGNKISIRKMTFAK